MRRVLLFFAPIALALAVVGISLAILRSLHRSLLFYVLFIPMWVTVLAVPVKVAWATVKVSHNGAGE
jgi:hypothetical protein